MFDFNYFKPKSSTPLFACFGELISLEVFLRIIVRKIWSKMDYIHQVSFVPSNKGLGAGKKMIDKVAFKLTVLIEVEIMAKDNKEEVIDLGDNVELTMLLIPAENSLWGRQ